MTERTYTESTYPDPSKKLQICFSEESGCHNINVRADSIDKLVIENGFLKVHDKIDNGWHCYNVNQVTHFHYPDNIKTVSCFITI